MPNDINVLQLYDFYILETTTIELSCICHSPAVRQEGVVYSNGIPACTYMGYYKIHSCMVTIMSSPEV